MTHNSPIIFDQKTIMCHQERAQKMHGDFDFLLSHARSQLQDRLLDIKKNFVHTIDLQSYLSGLSDEQPLSLGEEKTDCVISHLDMHWVNDLPGRFYQIRTQLQSDGVFLASFFGTETLYELRQSLMAVELDMFGGVSPRVSPFADMRDVGGLLQRAGFTLPVVDHELVTVTYDHVFKLIHDLRGMGQTNAVINRSKKYLGRDFWARVQNYYQENFTDKKGRLKASFEIIYLIGWAPADTQQKPLKPGSAKQSLASVLNTSEIKLPEKTGY